MVTTAVRYHFSMTTRVLPVLYSFRRYPYAIRARMALHYAGAGNWSNLRNPYEKAHSQMGFLVAKYTYRASGSGRN